jgi:hypothetical protein
VEFIYIRRRLTYLERSLQLQVDRLDNVVNGRCKASCCERIVQGTVVVMRLEILEHITIAPDDNNFIPREL